MARQIELPHLLQQSVVEKIADLQRRELDFAWEIKHPFEEYLLDWRTRIEEFFLRTFVVSLRDDRTWDWVTAQQAGFPEFLDEMLDGFDGLAGEAAKVAEEREQEAFYMGALYARWQLALGGLDDPDVPWPDYDPSDIGGLGFGPRTEGWADHYRDKVSGLFQGLVTTAATLPATMSMLDALLTGYTRRVEQLARNEWYHAAVEGEHAAVLPFGAAVGELWLIKDENACPICKALHMTITTKIPIKDTHPSCRCIKVPLVKRFNPSPVSLVAFADRHAQRPS